ncbi:carboxymuconolactone decarboxylase family protein [Nocardioides plantarum]|uniref:Uncharacterized protein n=1 Tax=Nocardioides plantarum TaxID=29299 RepID=A0ABV5KC11_9ACTN|nr:carboxymuconolactone decarboxylase family protein [Nocardioides plantarum]
MSDPWIVGGAMALQEHAPAAAAALGRLVSLWPEQVDEEQLAAIRSVTAEGLGLTPLSTPPTSSSAGPDPAVMAFAEQFAVDVSVLDDELRTDWCAALGPATYDATLVAWVADYVPRVRVTLDALFGADSWFDEALSPARHARLVRDDYLREVALLRSLDPVTTELVRLRGARHHTCRAGMSRRSLAAMEAGADAATFQAVDHYRASDLDPAQQAALALTDAITWMPAHLRAQDLAGVRAHLAPVQAVEVVLDVMRNAVDKIAVALGADAAEVEGIQLFEIDEAGDLHFP